jgi:hypothetical protein
MHAGSGQGLPCCICTASGGCHAVRGQPELFSLHPYTAALAFSYDFPLLTVLLPTPWPSGRPTRPSWSASRAPRPRRGWRTTRPRRSSRRRPAPALRPSSTPPSSAPSSARARATTRVGGRLLAVAGRAAWRSAGVQAGQRNCSVLSPFTGAPRWTVPRLLWHPPLLIPTHVPVGVTPAQQHPPPPHTHTHTRAPPTLQRPLTR